MTTQPEAAERLASLRLAVWRTSDPDDRIEARYAHQVAAEQFRQRFCAGADYVSVTCDLFGNVRIFAVTGGQSVKVWPPDG